MGVTPRKMLHRYPVPDPMVVTFRDTVRWADQRGARIMSHARRSHHAVTWPQFTPRCDLALFPPVQADEAAATWTPTLSALQVEIVCKALDLLVVILERDGGDVKDGEGVASTNGGVASAPSKRTERQSAVARAEEGLLSEMLAHVGFSRAEAFRQSPVECRKLAMRATGALVDGHTSNQYNLGEVGTRRWSSSLWIGLELRVSGHWWGGAARDCYLSKRYRIS